MKNTILLFLMVASLKLHADPITLTVSAAVSLKAPLETLKSRFEKANPGIAVAFNFGSSGSLEQQIVNGAPVDTFISAAAKQMDSLEKTGLIIPESRFVVVRNTVVLIAPIGSVEPKDFPELASVAIKTIAIGEPKSVPAGMYATEIFEHLGLASSVKDKLVYAKDVRQVLVYVEGKNADAGIVYGSDAAVSQAVRVVAEAPSGSHSAVEYPAAVVKTSAHSAEAATFLAFLRTPDATSLFKSAGFVTNADP